jgi:iron-sulfur cluster repair protein YtfE (RIC family)
MTETSEASNAVGQRLFEELVVVHDAIRRDLRSLADALAAAPDARPSRLDGVIESIGNDGTLWELRHRCLRHCRFVLGHHAIEDQVLFPAVADSPRAAPDVLNRLGSEHREIARHVSAFAEAARTAGDDEGRLDELRGALDVLTEAVLSHLAFEEDVLGGVMRAWTSAPWES